METTKELKLLCYSSIASRRARNISGLTGLDGPIKGFNKGADTMRSRTPDKSLSSSNSSLETIYFMFARALEDILRRYSSKADFGREAVDAFEHRFRSLRGSGLLPSGRENRAQRLSTQQIAYAILSTASIQPGWAGATAVILANLVPEGGAETSFFNVGTLLDTITKLIEDDAARASLILLTLSAAEGGLNSSGFANLVYIDASGQRRHSRYMHRLAANFTSPNNEARNDLNRRYAKMSRELVLNTAFFDALAREIDRSQHWPAPPGEGEEYTIEEIED
ncbi:MAG: hypothetical protein KJ961_09320, partial [Alphaproteobacteria bacterium]|nr:hypothetical protein [Alphaproteobacteria bacterium]